MRNQTAQGVYIHGDTTVVPMQSMHDTGRAQELSHCKRAAVAGQ